MVEIHSGQQRRTVLMRGLLTLVLLLGLGGHAVVDAPDAAASVRTTCSSVPSAVSKAVGHWGSRSWPSTSRGVWYTGTYTDSNNVIYGGGIFGDRDGQLRGYENNSAGTAFNEYDVYDYQSIPQSRGTVRIVRNRTSGRIYLTTDHYANYCVYR